MPHHQWPDGFTRPDCCLAVVVLQLYIVAQLAQKSWLAAVLARVIPPAASALHPPWSQFRLQRGQTFNSHVILVFVLVVTLLAMLTPISCWNVSQVALSNICSSWLWWLWRPELLHHVSSPALLQPSTVSRSLQSAFL